MDTFSFSIALPPFIRSAEDGVLVTLIPDFFTTVGVGLYCSSPRSLKQIPASRNSLRPFVPPVPFCILLQGSPFVLSNRFNITSKSFPEVIEFSLNLKFKGDLTDLGDL